jgi:pSer/pThr/pTyr-binding forkhead associated (FHA) protein
MTIVMEEDGFSSSLSSLSCLSPQQSNYQSQQSATTILTSSSSSSSSSNGIHNSSLNTNSSNSPNSLSDYNGPYALFLFRSNSSLETFEERRISLDKPCKIGRSVAKIKPEPNNAIFDCKVLSRNHALLWHENGKFYIQDTKSSNGTFLNGNRLGKSNEDSAPFDLTSGDIIQFGVDVTENTKKVTHGCITVELKLFFKPGVEATNKTNQSSTSNKIDVQTQEIYQLALFLQEAMMREEILNQKLNSLQKFIDQAKETSENNWLTIIDEDRLLSRIDYLEKQCVLHTKQFTDDSLKKCINNLTNEKFNIETATKQSLEKMIEEKNETAQKLDDLNTTFTIRNDECNKLQQVLDESKTSIIDLAVKYQELLNDLEEQKQNESENKLKLNEKINQFENEKIKYEQLYEESLEKEKLLNAKIESLIADNDFTSKRLEGILNKLEKEKLLADSSSTNLIVNDNNNKQQQQQMNTTTTISVNNTTTTTGYLNGKQDNNITYECNGFNHNHDNLETSDLNENQESIIKDEPSNLVVVDNHNVSLSKVEVDFAVERIIQKIENHQNVSGLF